MKNATAVKEYEQVFGAVYSPRFQSYNLIDLLNPHDYPEGLLERTDEGWLFRDLKVDGKLQNLELRAGLLDNGEKHTQNWWLDNYQQTSEGMEGWRLPTLEEFTEMGYALKCLSNDQKYRRMVRSVVYGNPQEKLEGLKRMCHMAHPYFADTIRFGYFSPADQITKGYDKAKDILLPEHGDVIIVGFEQKELESDYEDPLALTNTLRAKPDWLEVLAGEKWPALGEMLQYLSRPFVSSRSKASELRVQLPFMLQRSFQIEKAVSLERFVGDFYLCLANGSSSDFNNRGALGVRYRGAQ